MLGGRLSAATVSALLAASTLGVARAAPPSASWHPVVELPTIVDVVGPRADGRLVLATRGGLFVLRPGGAPEGFARGPGGFVPAGGEPYIALAKAHRLRALRCSYKRDEVFALDADETPGVVRIVRAGRAARLVDFAAGELPSGIAFDLVGRFGYRLLVTTVVGDKTTLYAIDCVGHATVVTRDAPHVEGGMVVAPPTFGRFGGDLIAADETSGRIFAFTPTGSVELVANSRLPAGGDIGVESLGFVPAGFGPRGRAYFSDLGAPGSPTEGTDSLLMLRGADLAAGSLRPGDLVAVTEAGARTISIRCSRRCVVRHLAEGPVTTHGEGHVTFVSTPKDAQ